jgi:hypothetical protein
LRAKRDAADKAGVDVLKAKLGSEARTRRPSTQAAAAGECRIALWRGYVTSLFYATVATPEGEERVVATSPEFRWWKTLPPPEESSDVRNAHRALVEQLLADGWVSNGQGREWFALRFRSRRPIERRSSD